MLKQRVDNLPYDSLKDLLDKHGVACAKSSTAYNNWLTGNIKHDNVEPGTGDYTTGKHWKKEVGGGLAGLVKALDDGTCNALIMESPSAEFMAQSDTYCTAKLRKGKGSLGLGVLYDLSLRICVGGRSQMSSMPGPALYSSTRR